MCANGRGVNTKNVFACIPSSLEGNYECNVNFRKVRIAMPASLKIMMISESVVKTKSKDFTIKRLLVYTGTDMTKDDSMIYSSCPESMD